MPLPAKPYRVPFPLGQTFLSSGVHHAIQDNPAFAVFVQRRLSEHAQGRWGDLDDEDCQANDQALDDGSRLLSAYLFDPTAAPVGEYAGETKVWIITEADRSSTTVLFPREY